ncbi:MAG: type II secretion system protein [Desulfobacterales bacterium]|nr:type II secretion system protein [Desulfobacterales bacterium]
MRKILKKTDGFTLIEMIAVLMIMGVVGAVVLSRMNSAGFFEKTGEAKKVIGHLRYAQLKSMKKVTVNEQWCLNLNSSTTYWLYKNVSPYTKVILPGESVDTVTLTMIRLTPQTICFDSFGSAGTATLTICNDPTITIEANTGFIH